MGGPLSSSPALAIGLGVTASLMFGVASVADQHSTHLVKQRKALSPKIFVDLAHKPLWLASIGGTLLGFALQVLALNYGPLALVEPLLACGLIFAVLINSYLRRRFDPILLGGVAGTAAGIAGFLIIANPSAGRTSVGFFTVLPLGAGLFAALTACLAVSRRSPVLKPLALALACGICYGVAAFLVKLVISDAGAGIGALLTDWPIYALAVVGPLGFLLNENAFQSGTLLAPVLSIITVCDPVISVTLGWLWLDEQLSGSAAGIVGEVLTLLLMSLGVVVITHRAQRLVPGAPDAAPTVRAGRQPG